MVWACGNNRLVPYGQKRLMAEVSGGLVRGRPRFGGTDGWSEGGFGQQRNHGGGCATNERVESPGAYVTD